MKKELVLGALYGDEGKGAVVQYLVQESLAMNLKPRTMYWSNGNQNGHTVIHNNVKHVCQTYGSGILLGAPTYRMRNTYLDPISAANEIFTLKNKGIDISNKLHLNESICLITPYDQKKHILSEVTINNGTTGLGVYSTVARVRDCYYDNPFKAMTVATFLHQPDNILQYLNGIRQWYGFEKDNNTEYMFLNATKYLLEHSDIFLLDKPDDFDVTIMEGTQGMGLCPFVTYPHCTATFVGFYGFCQKITNLDINLNLVIRTYATRHGNGPVSNVESSYDFSNIDETNQKNQFQGEFRRRVLSFDELFTIANSNKLCSQAYTSTIKNISLFITHMDVPLNNGYFEYIVYDQLHKIENPTPEIIIDIYKRHYGCYIGVKDYYYSMTPDSKFIKIN